MRQKKTPLYRSRVVLRVRSIAHVLDTCRYETLVPDTQNDVAALEGLDSGRLLFAEVTFRRYSMNFGPPNKERLASFLIELVSWEPVS